MCVNISFFVFVAENEVFQFFVRARDGGTPSLHADVPVDVVIIGDLDSPPAFEKRQLEYFISEGVDIGELVLRALFFSAIQWHLSCVLRSARIPPVLFFVSSVLTLFFSLSFFPLSLFVLFCSSSGRVLLY